ncbi:MAG: hypothetical protein ACRCWM_09885 [Sarcina sp.]
MRREDLLKKFLECHNIDLIDRDVIRKNFELQDIIENLVAFHSNVRGKRDYSMGLTSEAGRIRREQKISLMRMERFQVESDICLNEIIAYAKECISKIDEKDFIALIDRSYKNSEITIGRVYQNIYGDNVSLKVSDTSRVRFGMVEDDFIKLIKRMEKKERQLDYIMLLDEFIEKEKLDENSKKYIQSSLGYPSEIANYISFAYLRNFSDEQVKSGIADIESNFKLF